MFYLFFTLKLIQTTTTTDWPKFQNLKTLKADGINQILVGSDRLGKVGMQYSNGIRWYVLGV